LAELSQLLAEDSSSNARYGEKQVHIVGGQGGSKAERLGGACDITLGSSEGVRELKKAIRDTFGKVNRPRRSFNLASRRVRINTRPTTAVIIVVRFLFKLSVGLPQKRYHTLGALELCDPSGTSTSRTVKTADLKDGVTVRCTYTIANGNGNLGRNLGRTGNFGKKRARRW
jgi:hypothetical protein